MIFPNVLKRSLFQESTIEVFLISPFPVTGDFFLDHRLKIQQPAEGYRAAVDPVFLAAAVPARAGETVLDVGAGVGVASCCLASRCPNTEITGVEIFPELAALAVGNHRCNGFGYKSVVGDLRKVPFLGTFDHVMSNPPFGKRGAEVLSPSFLKQTAHTESFLTLKEWVHFCLRHLKPKGTLSFIFKTGRLSSLLDHFEGQIGELRLTPLWPKDKVPSKRIIVQGRKQSQAPLTLMPGLVLHNEDGSYTAEAENILRYGHSL